MYVLCKKPFKFIFSPFLLPAMLSQGCRKATRARRGLLLYVGSYILAIKLGQVALTPHQVPDSPRNS
jgi:hypothetical protein